MRSSRPDVRQHCFEGFGRAAGADAAARNADLVGRAFSDGASTVRVLGVSHANAEQVVVAREGDGHTWTIHAGIVRIILGPRPERRRAA